MYAAHKCLGACAGFVHNMRAECVGVAPETAKDLVSQSLSLKLMANSVMHLLCFVQVMSVQIECFQEIITIGYRVYHSYDLPWFRTLSW